MVFIIVKYIPKCNIEVGSMALHYAIYLIKYSYTIMRIITFCKNKERQVLFDEGTAHQYPYQRKSL